MKITNSLIIVSVLGFLAIIGAILVVVLTGHDAIGFVGVIGTLFTIVGGFIVLIRNQGKQAQDIATVKANTNGTLSAKDAQIDKLVSTVAALLPHVPTDLANAVVENTQNKSIVDAARAQTGETQEVSNGNAAPQL